MFNKNFIILKGEIPMFNKNFIITDAPSTVKDMQKAAPKIGNKEIYDEFAELFNKQPKYMVTRKAITTYYFQRSMTELEKLVFAPYWTVNTLEGCIRYDKDGYTPLVRFCDGQLLDAYAQPKAKAKKTIAGGVTVTCEADIAAAMELFDQDTVENVRKLMEEQLRLNGGSVAISPAEDRIVIHADDIIDYLEKEIGEHVYGFYIPASYDQWDVEENSMTACVRGTDLVVDTSMKDVFGEMTVCYAVDPYAAAKTHEVKEAVTI